MLREGHLRLNASESLRRSARTPAWRALYALRCRARQWTVSRDAWVLSFVNELRRLRPHLTERPAWTIALALYRADADPARAARTYHKRMLPEPAPSPAKKRRAK